MGMTWAVVAVMASPVLVLLVRATLKLAWIIRGRRGAPVPLVDERTAVAFAAVSLLLTVAGFGAVARWRLDFLCWWWWWGIVTSPAEIHVINADGSAQVRVTTSLDECGSPAWSPDGSQIAFVGVNPMTRDADLHIVGADGSGQRPLVRGPSRDSAPAWLSSDRIGFVREGVGPMTVRPDGTEVVDVVSRLRAEQKHVPTDTLMPSRSTDGAMIVFTVERRGEVPDDPDAYTRHLYTVAPDGSGSRRLTSDRGFNSGPRWSPDGTAVAYLHEPAYQPDKPYHVELRLVEVETGRERTLATGAGTSGDRCIWRRPVSWSPSGAQIAGVVVPAASIVRTLALAVPLCLLILVPPPLVAVWVGVRRQGWSVLRAVAIAAAGPLGALLICGLGHFLWFMFLMMTSAH